MRKQLFTAVLFTSFLASKAQIIPPQGSTPMTGISDQAMFQDKRALYFYEDSYLIEGRQVFGSPFLYHEWEKGVITTVDGRVFPDYKLKYDAFNQTVYFSNGTDSLEVNDEVKDFTLTTEYPDTVIVSRFIYSNQFKKEKKPFFYEVLLENEAGQLLKTNKKFVNDSDKGIPAYEGKKYFDIQVAYYYYDKKQKTVSLIKANGSNINSLLHLTDDAVKELNPVAYHFNTESEILSFFTAYFRSAYAK